MACPSMSSTVGGDQIQRHYSDPFNEKIHNYDEPTSPTKAYIPAAVAAAASQDAEKAAASHNSAPSLSEASSSDQTSVSRVGDNIPISEDTEGLTKTLVKSLHSPKAYQIIDFI